MNNIYNLRSIFHKLIIAIFLLSFSGCGVKKPPYYQDDVSSSDDKVKYILLPSQKDEKEIQNLKEEPKNEI